MAKETSTPTKEQSDVMGAYPACRPHTATLSQTSSHHPVTSKAALGSLSHLGTEGLEATDTLPPPKPRPET